jgi:hypothetical protein
MFSLSRTHRPEDLVWVVGGFPHYVTVRLRRGGPRELSDETKRTSKSALLESCLVFPFPRQSVGADLWLAASVNARLSAKLQFAWAAGMHYSIGAVPLDRAARECRHSNLCAGANPPTVRLMAPDYLILQSLMGRLTLGRRNHPPQDCAALV